MQITYDQFEEIRKPSAHMLCFNLCLKPVGKAYLQVVLKPLDKNVGSFYGNQGGVTLPPRLQQLLTIEHLHVEENPILKKSHLETVSILLSGPTLKEIQCQGSYLKGTRLKSIYRPNPTWKLLRRKLQGEVSIYIYISKREAGERLTQET